MSFINWRNRSVFWSLSIFLLCSVIFLHNLSKYKYLLDFGSLMLPTKSCINYKKLLSGLINDMFEIYKYKYQFSDIIFLHIFCSLSEGPTISPDSQFIWELQTIHVTYGLNLDFMRSQDSSLFSFKSLKALYAYDKFRIEFDSRIPFKLWSNTKLEFLTMKSNNRLFRALSLICS